MTAFPPNPSLCNGTVTETYVAGLFQFAHMAAQLSVALRFARLRIDRFTNRFDYTDQSTCSAEAGCPRMGQGHSITHEVPMI